MSENKIRIAAPFTLGKHRKYFEMPGVRIKHAKTRPADPVDLNTVCGRMKLQYFNRTIRDRRFTGYDDLKATMREWAAEFSGQCGKFYIAVMLD